MDSSPSPFPLTLYHPTFPFQFESIFLQLADRRRAGALSVHRGNCGDDLWLPREQLAPCRSVIQHFIQH